MRPLGSRDYEGLRRAVRRILRETASYTPRSIEYILQTRASHLDQKTLKAARRFEEEILHDREYCRTLGVDYCNLAAEEFKRIKVAAFYLSLYDPDCILPWL